MDWKEAAECKRMVRKRREDSRKVCRRWEKERSRTSRTRGNPKDHFLCGGLKCYAACGKHDFGSSMY